MTTITVKKLIELIKNADYLDKKQKATWEQNIPKMTLDELEELATIIASAELEKKVMNENKDYIIAGMASIYTALNENAIKLANKDTK